MKVVIPLCIDRRKELGMIEISFKARARRKPAYLFFVFALMSLSLFVCGLSESSKNSAKMACRIPPQVENGLRTASPERVGIFLGAMEALERRITEEGLDRFGSLLVLKDGYLIYERYSRATGREHRYTIYSVLKIFTSVLVGIALRPCHRSCH